MKLEQIDKNFVVDTNINEPDLVWHNVKEYPFAIHGVMYDETEKRYLRVPSEIACNVSKGLAAMNRRTAGGRVRFRTDSSFIAIRVVVSPAAAMSHMPRTGQSGFDMYRMVDERETYFTTFLPPTTWENGYTGSVKTYGELTDYTINFPLYDGVQELYIAVKEGAVLESPTPYKNQLPVVFYGSSITQGGCASRPGNSYEGFLSRYLSMDYINLGFSGSAKGERAIAEYIATLPMSIFVLDYDYNAPTEEALLATHYPFYQIVRDANPTLPIVFMSSPTVIHDVYTGIKIDSSFGSFENRRNIVRDTYLRAQQNGDENVYFIDGKDIFQGDDWDACTVDGVHPNDLGFYRYAQCLEPVLTELLRDNASYSCMYA